MKDMSKEQVSDTNKKCCSCIGRFEYKTAIPCRYCKWNTEQYWGRNESKMIEDHYRYVNPVMDSDLPY